MMDYDTKYGTIHVDPDDCRDNYENINVYVQNAQRLVKLQGPALRAFKAAEERVATKRRPHILITGIGWRSCATQWQAYNSDPGRFADPRSSLHPEGLAIDVDQGQGPFRLAKIRKALEAEGWHYGVSGEPWHASFNRVG